VEFENYDFLWLVHVTFLSACSIDRRELGENRQLHDFAAAQGGLVGANSRAGPIHRLQNIGERGPILHDAGDKFIDQVGVRSAMAAALNE
jgi:hypothetical protein